MHKPRDSHVDNSQACVNSRGRCCDAIDDAIDQTAI